MKEHVLVTGGSGFIGTNLVERLCELGFDVTNFDISVPRNAHQSKYFKFVDLKNVDILERQLAVLNPDYVIHLAARTDLNGDSCEDYNDNIEGVENLCKAVANKPGIKRILFTSSMLVCEAGYTPANHEDYCPGTYYGESKVEGEKIVRKYARNLPPYSILRLTSIWGPWFEEPYQRFFRLLLAHKYFKIGSKSSTKTFGYVGNAVNQLISLLRESHNNKYDVAYIGDLEPLNIDTWADNISDTAQIRRPLRLPFFIFRIGAFVGDALRLVGISFPLNSFRLKNMTTDNVISERWLCTVNVYPMFTEQEGIEKTLQWLKNN